MRIDRMKCDRCGREYNSNRILPLGKPNRMYRLFFYFLPVAFERLGVPYYICDDCRSDFMDFMYEFHYKESEEKAKAKEQEQRGGRR